VHLDGHELHGEEERVHQRLSDLLEPAVDDPTSGRVMSPSVPTAIGQREISL